MDGADVVPVSLGDEWERTFDAVPDLIAILDTRHRLVRANRALAEWLGRQPKDLVGMSCYELVHGTNTPPMFCPHSKLLCDGKQHAAEVEDTRLGGTFLVSVSPLRDADGMVTGSVHVARDITRQKQAEADARKAVNQREMFFAMLSHELRNPLGAILNAAYIVKRAPPRHSSFQEALAVIERQATQMSVLLDDLLDVSRVLQGKIEIRREVVDLADVIRSAVGVVQPACAERNQSLDVRVEQQPLVVRGDAIRLQQAQVNLLNNASKYTAAGGWIRVDAFRENDQVVVQVTDNGRGIPAGKLESIFDLFEQADESLDRQEGGMGIGLTLVRMLIQMHGGAVSAHSEGEGQGSRFVVRLPCLATAPLPSDPAEPAAPSTDRSRVLIVEDNADSRTMLQALLELDGHAVRAAEDGIQGLEDLKTHDFDVAIIDIGLPGIDGYEIVRQFRALRRSHIPRLIALTGYGRPSDRKAVLEAGFDEHIVKPCDPQDIERILHDVR